MQEFFFSLDVHLNIKVQVSDGKPTAWLQQSQRKGHLICDMLVKDMKIQDESKTFHNLKNHEVFLCLFSVGMKDSTCLSWPSSPSWKEWMRYK